MSHLPESRKVTDRPNTENLTDQDTHGFNRRDFLAAEAAGLAVVGAGIGTTQAKPVTDGLNNIVMKRIK
jgi:hypothetical protein